MKALFLSTHSITLLVFLYKFASVEASTTLRKRAALLSPRQTCQNPTWTPLCPGAFPCVPPGGLCCSDGVTYAIPPQLCPDGTQPVATSIVSNAVSTTEIIVGGSTLSSPSSTSHAPPPSPSVTESEGTSLESSPRLPISISTQYFPSAPSTPPSAVPLLTPFSPSPQCTTHWRQTGVLIATPQTVQIPQIASVSEAECMPSGSTQGTYSPGMCTQGQTLAYAIEQRVLASGTAVGGPNNAQVRWNGFCCDSGMTYTASSCFSLISTAMTGTSGSVFTTGGAYAKPFEVLWAETDISAFPKEYSASLAAALGLSPSDGSRETLPPSAAPSTPPTGASGLTTGAKAGIGVGAAIFVVAVVVAAILFLVRRRRRRAVERGVMPELENTAHTKRYLQGQWRAEAQTVEKPQELDSRPVDGVPCELAGESRTQRSIAPG